MPRHRRLVVNPPATRGRGLPATTAASAFSSSSTRLNTHVLLGLSLLVLSANARPLDASGGEANTGLAGLLSGKAAEWSASAKGALGDQLAESFLKLFHLNNSPARNGDSEVLLGDVVAPMPEVAEHPAFEEETSNAADSTEPSADGQDSFLEQGHALRALLDQNPILSIAFGVTDLMHKMRELFVDIAILEGEERGILVRDPVDDASSKDGLLVNEFASAAPHHDALGLTFQSEPQMPELPAEAFEEDPPLFELEVDVADTEVSIPGEFNPTSEASVRQASKANSEPLLSNLNPMVNPYAALALSSVLATLFVVGVVVGRHYYLTACAADAAPAEDHMERGEAGAFGESETEKPGPSQPSTGDGGQAADGSNEKAPLELQPTPASYGQSPEQAEAQEALDLLVDVAKAAIAASSSGLAASQVILNSPQLARGSLDVTGTPRAVVQALETIKAETVNTPQLGQLQLGRLNSRPGTPSTQAPLRPMSPFAVGIPAFTFTVAQDNQDTDPEKSSETDWSSPKSVASSFVSAYSTLPRGEHGGASPVASLSRASVRSVGAAAWSIGRISGSKRQRKISPFHPPRASAPSPAPTFVTASESTTPPQFGPLGLVGTMAARDVIVSSGNDVDGEREVLFHTPPTRPSSPPIFRQHPGGLMFYEDQEEETINFGRIQPRQPALPPVQLTQAALELALMLPATEWVFQFIIVFIGWFGFWMRPVPATRPRRRV